MSINIKFFNSNKSHNMVLSGYYTLCNSSGKECIDKYYDIFSDGIYSNESSWKSNTETVRVYNKKWLEPEVHINVNNVYRVHLNVRNREKTDLQSDYHDYFGNECADIKAFYQREGTAGDERIVWHIGNKNLTEDDWLNNRAWPEPPAPRKQTQGSTVGSTTNSTIGRRSSIARPITPPKPTTSSLSAAQKDQARRNDINNYFRSMSYSDSLINSILDEQGKKNRLMADNDGRTMTLERYEEVLRPNSIQEMLITCDKLDIYPGMLLVVDKKLGSENPTELNVPRGGTLNINTSFRSTIPGGNTRIVRPNAQHRFADPVNDAIDEMCSAFVKTGENLTANFRCETTEAESTEEMALKIGCSASYKGISATTTYEKNKKEFGTNILTNYSQVYFSANAEIPLGFDFSTLFDDSVTLEDIKNAAGENNPILIVTSVNYGRNLFLTENISGSSRSVAKSVQLSIDMGFNVKSEQSYSKKNTCLKYQKQAAVYGGDVTNTDVIFGATPKRDKDESDLEYFSKIVKNTRMSINTYINSHKSVRVDNGNHTDADGAPISYKAKMICTNMPDVTFWDNNPHRVKRIYKIKKPTINFFNSSKTHYMMISGCYTRFNPTTGEEIPIFYDIWNTPGRVFNSFEAWRAWIPTVNQKQVAKKEAMDQVEINDNHVCRIHLAVRDKSDSEYK